MLTRIKFLQPYNAYGAGTCAGFPQAVAEKLVSYGIAVMDTDEPAAPEASPVLRKLSDTLTGRIKRKGK